MAARSAKVDRGVDTRSPMCQIAMPDNMTSGTSTTTKYLDGWYEVIDSMTKNPSTQIVAVRTRTLDRNPADALSSASVEARATSETHGSKRIVLNTARV